MVYNHFACRDVIDAHNALRMYPIALKETWKTSRWPNRVFQFLLAITEINVLLMIEHVYDLPKVSQQEFCRMLAEQMIRNEYLEDMANPKKRRMVEFLISTLA